MAGADVQWWRQELGDADLGDRRLTERLSRITGALAQNPDESIPGCFEGDRHGVKATYRFFDNDSVDPEEILAAHRASTVRRIEAAGTPFVLVVQDTTQFDFTKHHATKALGSTGGPGLAGFFLHSALALDPDAGVPLGLLDWHWWVRDSERASKSTRRKHEIASKESGKWLEALPRSTTGLPAGVHPVTVADREADIFEFLERARALGHDVLVRAHHNRRIVPKEEAKLLRAAATAAPALGTFPFVVPRQAGRSERTATAVIRVASVEFRAPDALAARHLAPIPVQVIFLREIEAPDGEEPVQWLLLTTLPVPTLEAARRCVTWYTYRWRIERFHYTLKSGGNYEKLQLETAGRLWRALATYMVVAWHMLYVDLVARVVPQAPCSTTLTDDEWKALACLITKTPVPPSDPPDARTAIRWIAQLGGFLGRKGDGEPGVKTLWRGLRRLHVAVAMWRVMQRRE